jgi:hypothetical protein
LQTILSSLKGGEGRVRRERGEGEGGINNEMKEMHL